MDAYPKNVRLPRDQHKKRHKERQKPAAAVITALNPLQTKFSLFSNFSLYDYY
jgi:hypothetical protein